MKPATAEWVKKAEGDFTSALRDYRARKDPNYDGACFHAQQCVEKYLKARLQEASIPFAKTHDLSALLKLVLSLEPLWAVYAPGLHMLTDAAVELRYPGKWATKTTAKDATDLCKRFRKTARASLGIR